MITTTLYYVDGISSSFNNKEECEKAEEDFKIRLERWKNNSPSVKLDKLKYELQEAMYVSPGTICTCPYDSLRMKQMVIACQNFVNENRQYLSHY